MKLHSYNVVFYLLVILTVYRVIQFHYEHAEMEAREQQPFDSMMELPASSKTDYLPRGIVEARSDLELKPLWSAHRSKLKIASQDHHNLLAVSVGIKQKKTGSSYKSVCLATASAILTSVNLLVQKFIPENFSILLFHYDGNVNGWDDLEWCSSAIHVAAKNQTKWWFAKRFLHPDVVSIYDYIFLWDEDLGVENFDPARYLSIMRSQGLEISQPALDPDLSLEIHHSITLRKKKRMLHKRIHDRQENKKCSNYSEGPPCTGWVEGMAPVFSRSAWQCVWNLIQNDLVHGWGMDVKVGHCAKGDPRKKVGVIDSEFIVHHGIQTLGGGSEQKVRPSSKSKSLKQSRQGSVNYVGGRNRANDLRIQSRRQATAELGIFQDRWDRATKEDKRWVDPFSQPQQRRWVDPFSQTTPTKWSTNAKSS